MSDAPEILPDYPPIRRGDERNVLLHTRDQAEAGKIYVAAKRIPHHGRTDEKQREA